MPQPAPRRINSTQSSTDSLVKQPTTQSQMRPVNGVHQQNPAGGSGDNHKKASPTTSNGDGDEQVLPKPITNEEFQAMIPAHFLNKTTPNTEPVHAVTVTVKKPDPIELPPAPTGPGRVTETITKSTFTETVVTRITDNKLVVPVIIEVWWLRHRLTPYCMFIIYAFVVIKHTACVFSIVFIGAYCEI